MNQLNRVELVGIVGNVRVQEYDGTKLARIGLATNYAYKDREGTCVIETAWHNIIAWEGRNIPDLLAIRKGSKLHLFGRIRYQRYTGVDGIERSSTEIITNKMEIVGDEKTVLKMED